MPYFKSFLVVVLLTQLCVANEFQAFCDVCRLVNPDTKCPEDLACSKDPIDYDGIVATCSGSHIATLKASNKGLSKIPDSLNNMTSLQILNLGNNKLKSLPVLSQLTALKTVYLHSNSLESFTGVFVNSNKLDFISAGNNQLKELPLELVNMSLKTLIVNNNNLTTIPLEFKQIKTLVNVDISENLLDCAQIRVNFTGIFAEQCIQSQQKTEKDVPGLPLSYSGEPTTAGLDGYEIAAIILFVIFLCLLIPGIILFVVYHRKAANLA